MFISSCNETADTENTMSVMHAGVCVVDKTVPLIHTKTNKTCSYLNSFFFFCSLIFTYTSPFSDLIKSATLFLFLLSLKMCQIPRHSILFNLVFTGFFDSVHCLHAFCACSCHLFINICCSILFQREFQ